MCRAPRPALLARKTEIEGILGGDASPSLWTEELLMDAKGLSEEVLRHLSSRLAEPDSLLARELGAGGGRTRGSYCGAEHARADARHARSVRSAGGLPDNQPSGIHARTFAVPGLGSVYAETDSAWMHDEGRPYFMKPYSRLIAPGDVLAPTEYGRFILLDLQAGPTYVSRISVRLLGGTGPATLTVLDAEWKPTTLTVTGSGPVAIDRVIKQFTLSSSGGALYGLESIDTRPDRTESIERLAEITSELQKNDTARSAILGEPSGDRCRARRERRAAAPPPDGRAVRPGSRPCRGPRASARLRSPASARRGTYGAFASDVTALQAGSSGDFHRRIIDLSVSLASLEEGFADLNRTADAT